MLSYVVCLEVGRMVWLTRMSTINGNSVVIEVKFKV